MGVVTHSKIWGILAHGLNIMKLILITIIRHHFPAWYKFLNIINLSKIKGPVVSIPHGKLRGKTRKNFDNCLFYSFQGIPYAKAPTGKLRFKAPQPAEPWKGTRDAVHEGNDCLSRHTILKTVIGSDDCLTLNVYTPTLNEDHSSSFLKPVMVWIHGGGFISGSGSTEAYGPEFLLTEDVVLVSINYRIGILGFLSLKDPDLGVPGNAGLKDMVMALKWVQNNIRYFSGDPNNVTIFGESAGASAVHYLMLSPMAKGLFHKAILQSGCVLNGWAKGKYFIDDLSQIMGMQTPNEKEILDILENLPLDQLYKIAEKVPDPFGPSKLRAYGPVLEEKSEDAFLSEDPLDILKSGRYHHVPVIMSYTSREGILGEILQRPAPFKPLTDFELAVPHVFKLEPGSERSLMLAQHIKEFYYGSEEPSTDNKDKYYLLQTDNFFVREILSSVKYHSMTSSSPIFLCRISTDTTLNMLKKIYGITDPGVCHGDDLGYFFKNLLTPKIKLGSDEEIAIRRFIRLWTNFATTGNPNPTERTSLFRNVHWKEVSKLDINFLDVGKGLTMGVNPEGERMVFWDKIFKIYSFNKCF